MSNVNYFADVGAFHDKFELGYDGKPRALPHDLLDYRFKFLNEEAEEWHQHGTVLDLHVTGRNIEKDPAYVNYHLEEQLDGLVDLMYVLVGTACLQGFTQEMFEEAWRRVHAANMAKVRKMRAEDGHTDSGRAPTYDVVKPAGWIAPSHIDLIEQNAHV